MPDPVPFADRLVEARTAAGLKQSELLARLDGTAQSTLSAWETGKREPSVEDIRKLAKACRCTADYLLGLTDTPDVLPPGHWLVDDEKVDMIRAKKVPPKGRFAEPIPKRCRILSSTELAELEDELFRNRRRTPDQ